MIKGLQVYEEVRKIEAIQQHCTIYATLATNFCWKFRKIRDFGLTSVLDLIGIADALVKLSKYLQKRGRKIEALQVRKALKSFRFSKSSIDALLKLCEAETEDEAEQLVGLIAVRQRDTQCVFREARDVLNEFRFREGLSVGGEQILGEIVAGKTTVRRELLGYLLAASKGGAKDEIRAILALVISLNERIVELDDRLGGLMLD